MPGHDMCGVCNCEPCECRDEPTTEGRTMADEPMLKPCPWCGAESEIACIPHFYVGGAIRERALMWRASCTNDECPVGPCSDFKTEAAAIAAWNRRAPLPPPTEEEESKVALLIAENEGCGLSIDGRRALCFDSDAWEPSTPENCTCLSSARAVLAAFLKGRT